MTRVNSICMGLKALWASPELIVLYAPIVSVFQRTKLLSLAMVLAPYFQTESEYQEENRPTLGDIFGDAAKGAGGAFLDSVLRGILGGIRDQIK